MKTRFCPPLLRTALVMSGLLVLAFSTLSTAAQVRNVTDSLGPIIDPDVVHGLSTIDRVGVQIDFLLPGTEAVALGEDGSVHPLVVGLVSALLPGEMHLDQTGPIYTMRGVIDLAGLEGLRSIPEVTAIRPDFNLRTEPEEPLLAQKLHCIPNSTTACPIGGLFSLRVFMSGAYATVGATTNNSAVFWRFGSSNWEVVAKVIDGCSFNGYYWVFGAGATDQGYTLTAQRFGVVKSYNGGLSCPITDTTAFPCP